MVMKSRVARKSLPIPFALSEALSFHPQPPAVRGPSVAIIIIMLSAVDVVSCYALFGAHAQLVESLRVCGIGNGFLSGCERILIMYARVSHCAVLRVPYCCVGGRGRDNGLRFRGRG